MDRNLEARAWQVIAEVMDDEYAPGEDRLLCARVVLGHGADRDRDDLLLQAVRRLLQVAEDIQEDTRAARR